ncbi:MAG: ATP-binding protein [Gammaproteobacteria bacterium]|nr:ATP-binding protein [Gammaproteobacteria bacterium]
MIYRLPTVRSTFNGFECLGRLASETKDLFFDELILDMSEVNFFDANMAAPLGAVLARVADAFNSVDIDAVPSEVARILRKNRFLTRYGYKPLRDGYRTAMPFRRLRLSGQSAFEDYVDQWLERKGMPEMSKKARKAFKRKVFEIYQNAVIHSESDIGVFVCGQFFPKKKRLDFTIADAGIGIRETVRRYFENDRIGSVRSLRWALAPHHTTKRGRLPGGLGLQLLKDFTRLNGGKIQIASRFGFYEYSHGDENFRKMSADFPGTAVTIEVNTADESTYVLSDETAWDEIF